MAAPLSRPPPPPPSSPGPARPRLRTPASRKSRPRAPSPPPLPHLAGGTPGGPAPLPRLGGHFPSRRRKRRAAQREKEKNHHRERGGRPPPRVRHFRPGQGSTRSARSPGAILVVGSHPQGRWRPAAQWPAAGPPPGLCPGGSAAAPSPRPSAPSHRRGLRAPPAAALRLLPHRRDLKPSLFTLSFPEQRGGGSGRRGRCPLTCGAGCASPHPPAGLGAARPRGGARAAEHRPAALAPGAGALQEGDRVAAALYCSGFCSRWWRWAAIRPRRARPGRRGPRGCSPSGQWQPRAAGGTAVGWVES